MNRYFFTSAALLAFAIVLRSSFIRAEEPPIGRIGFGSCDDQNKPQGIWDQILPQKPELFIFLGDNIYCDTKDMQKLKREYAKLGALPAFQSLLKTSKVIATWDDHDYGANDAGSEYPMREQSQKVFLEFWNDPPDSPRRKREGVYESYVFGPTDKRVQVILLDTRYFRTPHKSARGHKNSIGLYLADDSPDATMLGEAQWKWLEEELRKPAEIRLIGSSVQFLADFYGIDAWSTFPREQRRMLDLLEKTRAEGVLVLSGDVHWGEIMRLDRPDSYPLYEVTSSGFTHTHGFAVASSHRIGRAYTKLNFGMVRIDWTQSDPDLTLQVHDEKGGAQIEHKLRLGELKYKAR